MAFTFPGQGTQRPGMGRPWADHPSWELVAEASEAAGRDVAHLLLDADADELMATRNAQLCTLTLSLVVLDAVERLGLAPGACAGHSLGEYTALVAAAALSLEDGVRLVVERGEATQDAVDDRPGNMAAVLGLDDDAVDAACRRVDGEAWVANYNAPQQVVVALSGAEFRLLRVFLSYPNRVLSRDQLMDLTVGREAAFWNKWLAFALLPLAFWGVAALFQKISTRDLAADRSCLWFLLGYLPVVLFVLLTAPMKRNLSLNIWLWALALGLLLGLGNLTVLAAYAGNGKASIITPLSGLYPVVTVPLAILFLHEKVSLREWIGIGLSFAAVAALSCEKQPTPSASETKT